MGKLISYIQFFAEHYSKEKVEMKRVETVQAVKSQAAKNFVSIFWDCVLDEMERRKQSVKNERISEGNYI